MKRIDPDHRNSRVSRRNFLRGAGVALTLPWMESLRAAETDDPKAAGLDKPPIRFGLVYFSNGVEPEHWWAKGSGKDMEIGPGLEPMRPYTQDINFLRGLYNQKAVDSSSPHLGRMPNMLSGADVSLDPAVIKVGTTMDQVIAQSIGHNTAVPYLALGIEPNELRLEDGVSMIYGSNVSWATPTKPASKEIYPARAFDRLVGDGKDRDLDRSILDTVLEQAHDLEGKISLGDRRKLGEYMDSVRDIEQRIERASQQGRLEGWRPTITEPNIPRPADELPQEVAEHMKLMLDIVVLAFQMDKTRVATLMLNNDLSQMNFGFIPGVHGALHLDLTHNGKAPELEAMYLRTNQFHVQQYAYILERMKGIDEGNGTTLLDNSIMMGASNLFDGDSHGADQMPILLAGHAGGSLQTGRVLDYLEPGVDDNRRACSLYLSIMDRMGVELERFGDTDKRLADL
ncbi:MAG: DUF1552 domain-containing protein [Acidobacteria bacterium]|nr:DUF1552 domain-containing protein [Acidobacteriota bacterium]